MDSNRLTGFNKLGSCEDCIILSLALLGLSLLLMGVAGLTNLAIMVLIGQLASAAFGLLVGAHALFFFLKRKKLVPEKPHRGCCGS